MKKDYKIEYLVGNKFITNKAIEPYNDDVCNFLADFSKMLFKSKEAKKYSDLIIKKANTKNFRVFVPYYLNHNIDKQEIEIIENNHQALVIFLQGQYLLQLFQKIGFYQLFL